MTKLSVRIAPVLAGAVRNVVAFAIFWLMGLLLVQLAQRLVGGWAAPQAGQLLAIVVGVALALRLRATLVAYLLGGFAAFSASELAFHAVYGNRSVQGAPTHFAVMGAGLLGVLVGALLVRIRSRDHQVSFN